MTGPESPEIEAASPKQSPRAKRGKKRREKQSKANVNNLLNIVGYLLSLVTSYLGGVAGWFGGVPNSEISSKYQTLVTPSSAYFGYIWALIFISQGIFAVAQLLPKYREQPLVQNGLGSIYFLACSAQTAWAITFGYAIMPAAFVAMCVLCAALLNILKRQWDVVFEEENKIATAIRLGDTTEEELVENSAAPPPSLAYWLLRFPFAVHAGWIAPATPLMLSVLLVYQGVDPTYELWVAVISIPLLFGGCMGLLLREESGAPVYTFPGVVAYACIGICWELQAPAYSILARHDDATISLMKNLAGFCGACLLVVMLSRSIALLLRDAWLKWNHTDETLSIDGEQYPYVKA